MLRVLPNQKDQQHQILKRVGQKLALFPKSTRNRRQANIPETLVKMVQDYCNSDSISWRTWKTWLYLTFLEHEIRVQHQKRYLLLYNIRKIHELFIQGTGRCLINKWRRIWNIWRTFWCYSQHFKMLVSTCCLITHFHENFYITNNYAYPIFHKNLLIITIIDCC